MYYVRVLGRGVGGGGERGCVEVSNKQNKMYARRTRSFSRTKMRSSKTAHMNKSNLTTEKIVLCTHMTVFKIGVHRNVDNWIQLLT